MQISVVIACFNAQDTLGVQLEALSRQTYRGDFEVLICDNGSTDGGIQVAESYRARLPGLRVIDASARRGPAHARNVGARASAAPWLAFCDADDEVAEGWLDAMATALKQNRFVGGRFESTRLNRGAVLRTRELQQDDHLQSSPFGPDLMHAGAGNMGVHRDVFLRVGGFDASIGCLEDTDLSWRIQLDGVPLVFAPEAVVHVRLRSSLPKMWAQGRSYGAASALLEHRFAGTRAAAVPSGTVTSAATPARSEPAAAGSISAKLLALIRDQHSLGGVLWQLGWHVGHRRWRPGNTVQLPVAAREATRRAS